MIGMCGSNRFKAPSKKSKPPDAVILVDRKRDSGFLRKFRKLIIINKTFHSVDHGTIRMRKNQDEKKKEGKLGTQVFTYFRFTGYGWKIKMILGQNVSFVCLARFQLRNHVNKLRNVIVSLQISMIFPTINK